MKSRTFPLHHVGKVKGTFFGLLFFFRLGNVQIDHMIVQGTQREYSSKPLKYSIVKRILVFKR